MQRLLVSTLALTSIGLGVFAYNEHAARGSAEELARSLQDKLDKIAQAKPAPMQLAPAMPQTISVAEVPEAPGEPATASATVRFNNSARTIALPADFMGMMDSPEVQQLMNLRGRAGLDERYAALFKGLNLPPDQLQKFQQLLMDKQNTMRDVMAAMRSQGISPGPESRDQMRTLMQNANAELDSQIQATLGSAAYAQYQTYEQTQPQRATVDRVQQRLSYSSQPLTEQQASQLVTIMAQEAQARNSNNATGNGGGGPRRAFSGGGSTITDATVQQASTILSAAQLATLQEVQQEQQAQSQLGRRAREAFTVGRPATPAGK